MAFHVRVLSQYDLFLSENDVVDVDEVVGVLVKPLKHYAHSHATCHTL